LLYLTVQHILCCMFYISVHIRHLGNHVFVCQLVVAVLCWLHVTLDIKDMYVNLPIPGILLITNFWLNKHNNYNKQQNENILHILNVIIRQNYFQHEGQIFQPEKGIAMGSPLSSTIAEIYLQYFENIYIKHWLDSKEIVFYKGYVDSVTLTRYRPTPWWWSVKIETCRSTFECFYVF